MSSINGLRIGILGAGHIGRLLANKLSAAGHSVKVANSGKPETIDKLATSNGALGVLAKEAVSDVEVLIISIPLNRILEAAKLIASVPPETVVIDTSNYYPSRDGKMEAIEAGEIESRWVENQLGRPIVKAWNSIGSDSLARKGRLRGEADRIALPFAGDRPRDKQITSRLIEETGFDAYDAGLIADSWRQQPGTPAYCTDLSMAELPVKLSQADRVRAPKRRDLSVAVVAERMGDSKTNPDADFAVRLCRLIYF